MFRVFLVQVNTLIQKPVSGVHLVSNVYVLAYRNVSHEVVIWPNSQSVTSWTNKQYQVKTVWS